MKYLSASRIHPVTSGSIENGILVVTENGTIRDVIDPGTRSEDARSLIESAQVERFEGEIVPGFINAHCHLELSHLQGKIPPGGGLTDFLRQIVKLRPVDPELQVAAMEAADREMWEEGIVAVGDISNTADSLRVKLHSRLRYHTFVEVFDLHPARATEKMEAALSLQKRFLEAGLSASVAPHAPYTVSPELMRAIGAHAKADNSLLTIHNQETTAEREMFVEGGGALLDFLRGTGLFDEWNPPGISSLHRTVNELSYPDRLLFVHNTFTTSEDLEKLKKEASFFGWCLCPKANRHIEGELPDIDLLRRKNARLMFGTDSLASNDRLSILDEANTIAQGFPEIPWSELLEWMTIVPAIFFGWQDALGSLEPGKRPGVNLIPAWQDVNNGPNPGTSAVKRLV